MSYHHFLVSESFLCVLWKCKKYLSSMIHQGQVVDDRRKKNFFNVILKVGYMSAILVLEPYNVI